MSNKNQIKQLEDLNSSLAKEILLNESAVYEVEKELQSLDSDLFHHPAIQPQIDELRALILRLTNKNEVYKQEIYENDLEITKLKKEDEGDE